MDIMTFYNGYASLTTICIQFITSEQWFYLKYYCKWQFSITK